MDVTELYHHGILGMKWGIRRYQPYGKGGYDPKTKGKNIGEAAKSAKTMSDEELSSRVKRLNMEKQYEKLSGEKKSGGRLESTKNVVDSTANAVNRMRNANREAMNQQRVVHERMDLSKMTDQQLRDAINRENLEIQYSNLFGPTKSTVTKGQEYTAKVLDVAGDVLAVGSSALAIALAIKGLKG